MYQSNTSGTNLTMIITPPKMLQIPRKLVSRVIQGCRFQITNQISHITNIFVNNRYPIFNQLINKLIN